MREWLKGVRARLRLVLEFARDWRRYERYSAPASHLLTSQSDARHIECQLTKDYHRVEKGLALATPKRPFGTDVAKRLTRVGALATQEPPAPYASYAQDALTALTRWNASGDVDSTIAPEAPAPSPAGASGVLTERRSIRHFDVTRPVGRDIVDEAVRLAQFAPSVCNRQPWLFRCFLGLDRTREVLQHQNGNRGFGDAVPALGVISVDLRLLGQAGERNQAWIEGGIFGMAFVTSLQTLGIASCMLNLSITNRKAEALRATVGMPAHEVPIMMVAFGYAVDGVRSARSPRRSLEEFVVYHD